MNKYLPEIQSHVARVHKTSVPSPLLATMVVALMGFRYAESLDAQALKWGTNSRKTFIRSIRTRNS